MFHVYYFIAKNSILVTDCVFKTLFVAPSLTTKTIFVPSTSLTFTIFVVEPGKFANAIIGVKLNPCATVIIPFASVGAFVTEPLPNNPVCATVVTAPTTLLPSLPSNAVGVAEVVDKVTAPEIVGHPNDPLRFRAKRELMVRRILPDQSRFAQGKIIKLRPVARHLVL